MESGRPGDDESAFRTDLSRSQLASRESRPIPHPPPAIIPPHPRIMSTTKRITIPTVNTVAQSINHLSNNKAIHPSWPPPVGENGQRGEHYNRRAAGQITCCQSSTLMVEDGVARYEPCTQGHRGEVNPKRLSVLISHHRVVMRSHPIAGMGHALRARVWARSGGVLVHKLSRAPAGRLCRSSIDTQSHRRRAKVRWSVATLASELRPLVVHRLFRQYRPATQFRSTLLGYQRPARVGCDAPPLCDSSHGRRPLRRRSRRESPCIHWQSFRRDSSPRPLHGR